MVPETLFQGWLWLLDIKCIYIAAEIAFDDGDII